MADEVADLLCAVIDRLEFFGNRRDNWTDLNEDVDETFPPGSYLLHYPDYGDPMADAAELAEALKPLRDSLASGPGSGGTL